MLKTILLLTPVYVTFFWAVVLHTDKKKQSIPRLFLGKFMIVAFIIYVSHFIFYSGFTQAYLHIDPIYQLVSLLVYPMYHIYFRLLTIDPKFSFKKHGIYLLAPIILATIYFATIHYVDFDEYSRWIFNKTVENKSKGITYLQTIHFLIAICYISQVILIVFANFSLIRKHGLKATNYYSDIEDVSTIRVQMLNYSMIVTGVASIILAGLGRYYFENEYTAFIIAAIVFSSMLFVIGWLGDRQKTLNPTFDDDETELEVNNIHSSLQPAERLLLEKITNLFETEKVYLNCKLNIMDIASAVGSNRTYISFLINKSSNQNFCSFVNQYRIKELEVKILNQPNASNHIIAEQCGFGSIDSMKRSVQAKTGLTIKEWKSTL